MKIMTFEETIVNLVNGDEPYMIKCPCCKTVLRIADSAPTYPGPYSNTTFVAYYACECGFECNIEFPY